MTDVWLMPSDWPSLHRRFLGAQVVASVTALCVFPLWIFWKGALDIDMALIFGWLMGPLLAAVVLARLRSLEAAFAVSAISLTGLICTVSVLTGGLQSFAMIWLIAVPFEALLSREKRIIVAALAIALSGAGVMHYGDLQSWFSQQPALTPADPLGFAFGPFAVVLYVAALAARTQGINSGYQSLLRANEARYRLLAENTSDLITQHDVDGRVVFASPAASLLLGVEPFRLEDTGFLERVHIADRPAYMQLLSDVATRGLPLVNEFRVRTQFPDEDHQKRTSNHPITVDHGYSWVEMRSRPIWNEIQCVAGIISITRDITERRMQEEELRAAHENLKELSDAKSRFLANMSHELRTPLNAIIGFSDILGQELFGKLQNEKQKEYIGLIHDSGNHLLQVVTDILDMSKIDSGTFDIVPEAFEVKNLIETCTGILSQQAEARGIRLRTLVPANLPEAVADPRACRQILINLISNAVKFSNEGDSVIVGVRLEGDNLAYFIRDKGIGMSKSDLARIGQPFFQADSALERRYEGTGLGISVVKGLTELHKGRVMFESELGKGTCVTIYIPLNCEAEQVTVRELNAKPDERQPSVNPRHDRASALQKTA